jgi:hypothetical protein
VKNNTRAFAGNLLFLYWKNYEKCIKKPTRREQQPEVKQALFIHSKIIKAGLQKSS